MSNPQFKVNFTPHAGQEELLTGMFAREGADIFTISAARGFGKTLFVTARIVIPRLLVTPGAQVLWVAPTYKLCKSPVDDAWMGTDDATGERFIPQFADNGMQLWEYKAGDTELEVFNGGRLYFRSADNPVSIVSKGYHLVVVDEAAYITRETFYRYILPTARRSGCKIVLISTPCGRNWFYEMYLSGQDSSKPTYYSAKAPWWKRPDYPDVLRRLMKEVPEHVRQQEFDAEFVSDGGGCFTNLASVFKGPAIQFPSSTQEWRAPVSDEERSAENFVLGVDLAKTSDYTTMFVLTTRTRRLKYYARLNKTDYRVVLERIKQVAAEYGADVIYDATGVGSGLGDFLDSQVRAHPFVFTNESKNEIVNKLIVSCEYGELELPNIQTVREEFELFTYTITRTGKVSYSAPSGKHDDCVMGLALANWYCMENGCHRASAIDEFIRARNELYAPRSELERLVSEE